MKKIVNLSLCLAMLISLTGCAKQPVKGKSIEEDPQNPEIIKTVRGLGYKVEM